MPTGIVPIHKPNVAELTISASSFARFSMEL